MSQYFTDHPRSSTINGFKAPIQQTQPPSFTRSTLRQIQLKNNVKKNGMPQTTHQRCTLHLLIFFILRILCAVNVKISRSSDIALIVNCLHESIKSVTFVTEVGRNNGERQYLSSSSVEVLTFPEITNA